MALIPTIASDPRKADKAVPDAANNVALLDATGNLVDSGLQTSDLGGGGGDVSGKADKVTGATSGNFAGLNGPGNLTDSGYKPADFQLKTGTISATTDAGSAGLFALLNGSLFYHNGTTWRRASNYTGILF